MRHTKENTDIAKIEEEKNLNSLYDELVSYNNISFSHRRMEFSISRITK